MPTGRGVRVIGLAVALGLLVLTAPAGADAGTGAAASAGRPSCEDQDAAAAAPDAVALARACGNRVEILSARTETDEVFAEPDGSTTLRRYAVPQRVRRGTGWVPVDPSLQLDSDGVVRPRAVPFAMAFSAGGADPLVSLAEEEGEEPAGLEISWPTPLPAPTLDGDTATYANVLPGVDLRVTASVEGFQQVLVVKNRTAASNPALRRVATRVTTTGVSLQADSGGRIEALDADGDMVFFSDGALMWDSPEPASNAVRAEVGGAGTAADGSLSSAIEEPRRRVEAMPVELNGDQLVVSPNLDMLAAPGTTYPVYIDPPWSRGSGSNWTTVDSCNPNTSYWSSRRDVMRVGRNPESGCRNRAFVNIPLDGLAGASIKTASFFSTMDHSSPCGSPTPEVRLAVTTQTWIQPWNAVTWNNTSDYHTYWGWVAKIVRPSSANEGRKSDGSWSCGADLGDKLVEWGGDIRDPNNNYVPGVIEWFTNRSYSTLTFGIYSSSEADWTTWKKFYADSSYLQVNYNRRPNTPTNQSISDCGSRCASPAVVSRRDPQLRTFATDPDGGNLNLYYEVQKADGTPVVSSPAVAYASGSTSPAQWRIAPVLPADGAYRWRVKSCDEWGDCSDSTGWFDFTVDTVPPPAAQVTPVDPNLYFPEDGSGRSSGGIGVPGQLSLRGDASVESFTWQLDGGSPTTVPSAGTDPRTATITVVPQADLIRSLRVTARDTAGRETTSTYRFRVTPPDPLAGHWNLNGNPLDSRDLSSKPNAVRHDGTATNVSWVDVTVPGEVQTPRFRGGSFGGTAGITVPHPVLATAANPDAPSTPRSFSVAAWVRFDGSVAENQYRTAVSQQGVNKSLFELGYQAGTENNFCFTMFATDSVGAAGTRACVRAPVVTGEWVHLAGVYDDLNDTATVYVHRLNAAGFVDFDNAVTATQPFSSSWAATGPFTIGGAFSGGPAARWKGVIDEVYAAQYAARPEDIQGWAQGFEIGE